MYPDYKTNLIYLDSRNPDYKGWFYGTVLDAEGNKQFGRIAWAVYRPTENRIYIDGNASLFGVVELIAHELAHVVTYQKTKTADTHGPLFQDVFALILTAFSQEANFKIED